MADKPSVLFVCVHNAGRSQIAAGLLSHLAGDRIEVRSAGTEPADQINPAAVVAMAERGIDITAASPKVLTGDAVQSSDVVITMGCGDICPYFPGVSYRDWKLADPGGQPLDTVRAIRDDIAERVQALITELLPTTTGQCAPEKGRQVMSRVQLALNVDDLDEAITFYSKLFNTAPAKAKPATPTSRSPNRHSNWCCWKTQAMAVPSTTSVSKSPAPTTCTPKSTDSPMRACSPAKGSTPPPVFATQDKAWVTGPGGEHWEVYTVLADCDTFGTNTDQPAQNCCKT